MSHIVGPAGSVASVDIDPELVGTARGHLASAGYPDVTVVAADGAEGYQAGAPYDRVIATVGVSDLAPAWLDQAGPDARIVVPLDMRGSQLSVAFERAGPTSPSSLSSPSSPSWVSRSIAPCGFMRMRGSIAGPERTVVLQPGLSLLLPDGLTLADGQQVDAAALAAFLDEPSVELPAGVASLGVQIFWGFSLWLAAGDRRSCGLAEERSPDDPRRPSRLARAPWRSRGVLITAGIVDSGGIAVMTAAQPPEEAATSDRLELHVMAFGPHASALGTDLVAHVQAWDRGGQRGVAGLRVEAYPRSAPAEPALTGGALLIERPGTRFVVYHT